MVRQADKFHSRIPSASVSGRGNLDQGCCEARQAVVRSASVHTHRYTIAGSRGKCTTYCFHASITDSNGSYSQCKSRCPESLPGQHGCADVSPRSSAEHFIRLEEQRWWHGEAKGLGSLEVDDQLELGELLHGQVPWLGALQDLVHVDGGPPAQHRHIRPIGHQASRLYKFPKAIHRRQPVCGGKLHDLPAVPDGEGVRDDDERLGPGRGHRGEGAGELLWVLDP